MKFCIFILAIIFFASCAEKPANKPVDEKLLAKNKQTAALNEVTELTKLAQKLELQGRGMEIFRQAGDARNMRECAIAMEDGQKQMQNFTTRVNNLPDNYKIQLIPITDDLNQCVSCSKNVMDNCRNARAAINDAIKKIYP